MPVVQPPKEPVEREALKKEILKFLTTHGADAKARTVTLKHFMKERNLPPLFIKRSMGRVGLEEKTKKPDEEKSKSVALDKLKLQKRVQKMLAKFDKLNEEAIEQVYDTLRKEGNKRRHIRTALYSLAQKLKMKYGPEASKDLLQLVNPKHKKSETKGKGDQNKKNKQNIKFEKKKMTPKGSPTKGKEKVVSFSGVKEKKTTGSSKKIPPTPIPRKSASSTIGTEEKKKTLQLNSPATAPSTSAATSPAQATVTPKQTITPGKLKTPKSEGSNATFSTPASSLSSLGSSKKRDASGKSVTPLRGASNAVDVKESPKNLNGSFIQSSAEKTKCNSIEQSNGKGVEENNSSLLGSKLTLDDEVEVHEEIANTPLAKASILKDGNDVSNRSSSKKKNPSKRVSFGSIKSPQVRTPIASRQSINLIDLRTPPNENGILEEECPTLVPINDAPTAKKGKKSPKYSPRVTRSAAKKKITMA